MKTFAKGRSPCLFPRELSFSQMRSNGLIIFVPKFGIEGPVYLTAKDKDKTAGQKQDDYVMDEELQTIRSKQGDTSYTVRLSLCTQ